MSYLIFEIEKKKMAIILLDKGANPNGQPHPEKIVKAFACRYESLNLLINLRSLHL